MEQRVSVKKTVAVRLEQELVQAHLAAGRAPKRRADSSRPAVSLPVSLWNLQVVLFVSSAEKHSAREAFILKKQLHEELLLKLTGEAVSCS